MLMYIFQKELIYRHLQVRWDWYGQKKTSVLILSIKKNMFFCAGNFCLKPQVSLEQLRTFFFFSFLFSSEVGTEK